MLRIESNTFIKAIVLISLVVSVFSLVTGIKEVNNNSVINYDGNERLIPFVIIVLCASWLVLNKKNKKYNIYYESAIIVIVTLWSVSVSGLMVFFGNNTQERIAYGIAAVLFTLLGIYGTIKSTERLKYFGTNS